MKPFKLTHDEGLRRTVFPERSRGNLKFIDISSRKTRGTITSASVDDVAIAIWSVELCRWKKFLLSAPHQGDRKLCPHQVSETLGGGGGGGRGRGWYRWGI